MKTGNKMKRNGKDREMHNRSKMNKENTEHKMNERKREWDGESIEERIQRKFIETKKCENKVVSEDNKGLDIMYCYFLR
jgi:hypothetical protein